MSRPIPEPELQLVPTEPVESDHDKLMRAYRKLAIQVDAVLERIRLRRKLTS